jgi:hypothetical protein
MLSLYVFNNFFAKSYPEVVEECEGDDHRPIIHETSYLKRLTLTYLKKRFDFNNNMLVIE